MKKRGFTLIELLVVIAIIAILAAILFPAMTSAKKKAQQVQCCNNQKQLLIAIRHYCEDNSGFMPFEYTGSSEPCDWCGCITPATWDTTKGSIFRYIRNTGVYKCPSNQQAKKGNTSTYSIPDRVASWYSNNKAGTYCFKLDTLACGMESRKVMLVEEKNNNDSFFVIANITPEQGDPFTIIHLEGGNVGFCDGHVAYKAKKWVDAERWSATHSGNRASAFWFNRIK